MNESLRLLALIVPINKNEKPDKPPSEAEKLLTRIMIDYKKIEEYAENFKILSIPNPEKNFNKDKRHREKALKTFISLETYLTTGIAFEFPNVYKQKGIKNNFKKVLSKVENLNDTLSKMKKKNYEPLKIARVLNKLSADYKRIKDCLYEIIKKER